MKIGFIYFNGEDIASAPLMPQIKYITRLFGNSKITLAQCENNSFNSVLKAAVKNNDIIFVSNKFYANFENENADGLSVPVKGFFKNIDDYSTGAKLSCFVTYLKHKPVAVLSANSEENKDMFSVLALDYIFGAENNYVAYNTFSATDSTLTEVNEILKTNCRFSNPHILVFEDKDLITLHIFATAKTQESADSLLNETLLNLKMLFGDECSVPNSANLAQTAVNLLLDKNLKIATAESCTAGMLSAAITSVENASKVFEIGISSYSNRIKLAALGVSKNTLDTYGAISMQTATEMASGIRELGLSDIGIGITGVAGPLQSEGHQVGTVYIALTNGKKNWVVKHEFGDNLSREAVREKATFAALDLLRRYLQCLPAVLPDGTDADKPPMLLYKHPSTTNNDTDFSIEPQNNFYNDIFSNSDSNADDETADYYLNQFSVTPPEEKENKSLTFKEKLKNFDFKSTKMYPMCLKFLNLYNFKGNFKRAAANTFLSIVILGILISTVYFIQYFSATTENDKIISEIRNMWSDDASVSDDGTLNSIVKLQTVNPEIMGWINIGNTEINNPVCQTDNNTFYENHNFKCKNSRYGSLYFTKESSIKSDAETQNTVISGKNAKNGTMFGSLKNFKDLSYISENNIINLTTLYDKSVYRIFSVMILADSPEANGSDFDYSKTSFTDRDDFKLWIAEVKQRSLFNIETNIDYSTKLLTLVTDSSEFSGAKLVIVAYETDAASVSNNVSITVNPSPRYPQIWYDNHNTQNPYADYVADSDFELDNSTVSSENTIIFVPTPNDTTSDNTSSDTTSDETGSTASTPSENTTSSNTSNNNTSSDDSHTSSDTTSSDTSSDTGSSEPVSSDTSGSGDTSSDSSSSDTDSTPSSPESGTNSDDSTTSDNTTE